MQDFYHEISSKCKKKMFHNFQNELQGCESSNEDKTQEQEV